MTVIIDRNTILGRGLKGKPMLAHRIYMHQTREKMFGAALYHKGFRANEKKKIEKQRKKKGYADKLQAVGRRIE